MGQVAHDRLPGAGNLGGVRDLSRQCPKTDSWRQQLPPRGDRQTNLFHNAPQRLISQLPKESVLGQMRRRGIWR